MGAAVSSIRCSCALTAVDGPKLTVCHAFTMLKSVSALCRQAAHDDDAGGRRERRLVRHPMFPDLPASVPLTYVLSMKACLSEVPRERPSFDDLTTLLEDCSSEVLTGSYTNSMGHQWVRLSRACPRLHSCSQRHTCRARLTFAHARSGQHGPGDITCTNITWLWDRKTGERGKMGMVGVQGSEMLGQTPTTSSMLPGTHVADSTSLQTPVSRRIIRSCMSTSNVPPGVPHTIGEEAHAAPEPALRHGHPRGWHEGGYAADSGSTAWPHSTTALTMPSDSTLMTVPASEAALLRSSDRARAESSRGMRAVHSTADVGESGADTRRGNTARIGGGAAGADNRAAALSSRRSAGDSIDTVAAMRGMTSLEQCASMSNPVFTAYPAYSQVRLTPP